MRRTAAPALLVLALVVGAAGCGEDSNSTSGPEVASPPKTPTTSETSEAPATPTATATGDPLAETGSEPFTGIVPDDGGPGSGNGLGLVGVRTARHDGYDRVVFDLGGTGKPGWRVQYTDEPASDGSGEPVALKGTVFLQVLLRGLGMPYDTGVEPFGDHSTRVPGTGTRAVTEIAPGGVFEGDQLAFIGLTGTRRPFRVFTLTKPTRLVVDVIDD